MRTHQARLHLAAALAGGAAAAQAAVPPLRLCADPANLPFSSNAADAAAQGAPGLYVEIGQAVADALGRADGDRLVAQLLRQAQPAHDAAGRPVRPRGRPAGGAGLHGAARDLHAPDPEARLRAGGAEGPRRRARRRPEGPARHRCSSVRRRKACWPTRSDITSVTAMDPEEAMRRLAAGEADAAFIWGPSAGYINHTALQRRLRRRPGRRAADAVAGGDRPVQQAGGVARRGRRRAGPARAAHPRARRQVRGRTPARRSR